MTFCVGAKEGGRDCRVIERIWTDFFVRRNRVCVRDRYFIRTLDALHWFLLHDLHLMAPSVELNATIDFSYTNHIIRKSNSALKLITM